MFITENQNIGDSVLFLLAARSALASIVRESNSENADDLVNFIYNEASDYQAMHLLFHGVLPEEQYDTVGEMLLFSSLKESMLINHEFVTEIVGDEIFENILNEVDSLYMGTSTTAPVLEFEAMTNPDVAIAYMISEAHPGDVRIAAAKKAAAALAKKKQMHNVMSSTKGANAAIAKHKINTAVAAGKTKAMGAYQTAKAGLTKAGIAGKTKASQIAGRMSGNTATQSAELSKAAAKSPAAHAKLVAQKKAHAVQAKLGSLKGANTAIAKHKIGVAAGKGAAFAKSGAGLATGGAAAAALAIYAGYKIYKRFFSQAAKSCAVMSGAAKTACMNKYKKGALIKQASAIQAASGSCAKSKNPAQCRAAIGKKVAALKAKAAKIAA